MIARANCETRLSIMNFQKGNEMNITKWSGVAAAVLLSSTALAAGTPPTIRSACVAFVQPTVARISGIVTDPDFDTQLAAPLGVGGCLNGTPDVWGVSYVCDVPTSTNQVTLVAADSQGNFSTPVLVKLVLGCRFF